MARAEATQNSFNFSKGIVTEVSPLAFPENASIDEENFELRKDGKRWKRLGIDLEVTGPAYTGHPSASVAITNFQDGFVSAYRWNSVANNGDLTFLAVQVGSTIHFHDMDGASTITNDKLAFTIDLNSYKRPASINARDSRVVFNSGKGYLFINSEDINPIYVKYDEDTATFTVVEYAMMVRDFSGLDDGLGVDERPATLSDAHKYNLYNQGWPEKCTVVAFDYANAATNRDPLEWTKGQSIFADGGSWYPSNSDVYYNGLAESATTPLAVGGYTPIQLVKANTNGQAPQGHFIIDLFNPDRSTASGIAGLTSDDGETARPQAATFHAGRIWLAIGDTVYFSQIIEDDENIERFYQVGDPTAELNNELAASDGGTITIPDAGEIIAIHQAGLSIIVFASNGIWAISGGESGGFKATDFKTSFVSNVKVSSASALVSVEGGVMFGSDSGIYATTNDKVTGAVQIASLTETTIQTLYLGIAPAAREQMTAVYDGITKKVFWFYNGDSSYTGGTFRSRYDSLLILDTTLGAWYKYTMSQAGVYSPYIYGGFMTPGVSVTEEDIDVVDSSDNDIDDSSANDVIVTGSYTTAITSSIKFIVGHQEGNGFTAYGTYGYGVAEFKDTDFVDWNGYNQYLQLPGNISNEFDRSQLTDGQYEAFLHTGWSNAEDILRNKQVTYIQCAFDRTEDAVEDNGSGGSQWDDPSSCLLSSRWEWSDNSVSGKISSEQQVYRFRRPFITPGIGGSFDNGYPLVLTKTKLRGRGKSVSLYFRAPSGYNCRIVGWAILMNSSGAP